MPTRPPGYKVTPCPLWLCLQRAEVSLLSWQIRRGFLKLSSQFCSATSAGAGSWGFPNHGDPGAVLGIGGQMKPFPIRASGPSGS